MLNHCKNLEEKFEPDVVILAFQHKKWRKCCKFRKLHIILEEWFSASPMKEHLPTLTILLSGPTFRWTLGFCSTVTLWRSLPWSGQLLNIIKLFMVNLVANTLWMVYYYFPEAKQLNMILLRICSQFVIWQNWIMFAE